MTIIYVGFLKSIIKKDKEDILKSSSVKVLSDLLKEIKLPSNVSYCVVHNGDFVHAEKYDCTILDQESIIKLVPIVGAG